MHIIKRVSITVALCFAYPSFAMNSPENIQAKQLVDAIIAGNRQQFDNLLKAGVNHLSPYHYMLSGKPIKRTPIMIAIMYHQFEMGKRLLEKNHEEQIPGIEGDTLMHYMAMCGSHEFIPLLMSLGGEIDGKTLLLAGSVKYSSQERSEKTREMLNHIESDRKSRPAHLIKYKRD